MNFRIALALLGTLMLAPPAWADPDVPIPLRAKQACKDCPFPLTLNCIPATDPVLGGPGSASLRCELQQKRRRAPVREFHCSAAGGSDTPFPLRCSVEQ